MRLRHMLNAVLVPVLPNIIPSGVYFLFVFHPKPIVIVVRLVRRLGPSLVNYQKPVRIRMLQEHLSLFSLDHLKGQKVRKDRKGIIY